MPKLRKREGAYDKLLFLLRGYGVDGPTLAAGIGKSPSTGNNRLRNPGSLTPDELRKLSRAGIPIAEIRDAI